jgi:hypothetical protein
MKCGVRKLLSQARAWPRREQNCVPAPAMSGNPGFLRPGALEWIPIFLRWRDDLGRRRVRGALVNWRDRVFLTHDAG